ncbi:dual specificity protein phosphatase MPK-4 [Coccinella septempunctata]|uniref:dual specificity protein phosphatase MPK-4 n=1 Tax=Coccinella septempunctata TaxID=41139 RepID=UPI001D064C59|nr:dual specificity protein phosphatase MPK-4 [Coccinella septempunctata]
MHKMCDLNLGPISVDLIEPNLYLGGLAAAKDVVTLGKLKITHILTIDTCPLPRQIRELKGLTIKFVQLSDQPKEDLLSYFDETQRFIEEGVCKGNVLVHCYFGVSRSATVVIAYVMKTYNLTYVDAFQRVKLKRSIVYPNHGFVSQLQLYEQMNYTIDKNYMHYKIFRLSLAADRFKKIKILPQNFIDCIKGDPGLVRSQPETNVYRCKKCRRVLAGESNLITHENENQVCRKTFFIEPLEWMNVAQIPEGKLYCPKCKNKLGSFNWIMSCQCPCGRQIAPAFYLNPCKVDFTNVVKNVEVTF